MTLLLSAPSKTFLTGEYAVLGGGQALVLNTTPRFELRATRGADEAISGIPTGSPAELWLKQRAPLLRDWTLQFHDPHRGRGGFGASGAQFLLVHTFTTLLQAGWDKDIDPADVWNDYQVLSRKTGSGADVLAQIEGHVARVDLKALRASKGSWPYPELGFAIIRTGSKIQTHAHLRELVPDSLAQLVAPANEAAESFGRDTGAEFIAKLKVFTSALRELNLQSPRTLQLLQPFLSESWCLAAKGCGALGADTILLMFAKEHEAEMRAFVEGQNLELVSTELSGGLEVRR